MDLVAFITGKNFLLFGGVIALSQTVRSIVPTWFATKTGERLLPVIPVILGVAGAIGGVCEGASTLTEQAVLGMVVGFAAGHSYKIGKTTIAGAGINPTPQAAPPAPQQLNEENK